MLGSERKGSFEQTELQDFEANRSLKSNHRKRIQVEMETCSTLFIDKFHLFKIVGKYCA